VVVPHTFHDWRAYLPLLRLCHYHIIANRAMSRSQLRPYSLLSLTWECFIVY